MTVHHYSAIKASAWILGAAAFVIAVDPTVKVAMIAAVPATIAALGTLILGLMNRTKLNQIDHNVNGKLTRLLDEKAADKVDLADKSDKLSRAEGRREGVESKEK